MNYTRINAIEYIKNSLKAHPKLPLLTQHVMRCLTQASDAPQIFRKFDSSKSDTDRFISVVRQSLESALREARQSLPSSIRNQDLRDLQKQMSRLVSRITAIFPPNVAHVIRPQGMQNGAAHDTNGHYPLIVSLGWHSVIEEDHCVDVAFSIAEILEYANAFIAAELQRNYAQSVERVRGGSNRNCAVTPFIRHLAWHFYREYHNEMPSTIARITNAVFALENTLIPKDVENRLAKRPDVFKPPSKVAKNLR